MKGSALRIRHQDAQSALAAGPAVSRGSLDSRDGDHVRLEGRPSRAAVVYQVRVMAPLHDVGGSWAGESRGFARKVGCA